LSDLIAIVTETYRRWSEDRASHLAAALAYYAVFAMAPLLVIAIAVAGLVYGERAARDQIVGPVSAIVGQQAAEAIQQMIANASTGGGSVLATGIGIVTMLLGASGVFVSLQTALNTVFGVEPAPGQGIRAFIKRRGLAFAMVLALGLVLLILLAASTALSALGDALGELGYRSGSLVGLLNYAILVALLIACFAALYKLVPDVYIAWRDVLVGAAVTAVLFAVGTVGISIYLGQASVGSAYGAAGSLVAILVWVYYSAQVFLLGAEFTAVYAERYGRRILPASGAVRLPRVRLRRQEERREGVIHPGSIPHPPEERDRADHGPAPQ